MAVGISRLGSHLPNQIVTNAEISAWSEVPLKWVEDRTGITQRRYADPEATTSDMAARAVVKMLGPDRHCWPAIDAVIVATSTGDQPQPATAAILQDRLDLPRTLAFDINAVCCGFLFALEVAQRLVAGNSRINTALVAATDLYSRIMDRTDRTTVSLFGDGAAAALVEPVPDGFGLQAVRLVTDGDLHSLVQVPAGGTAYPLTPQAWANKGHLFRMNGHAVRDYVLTTLPEVINDALDDCGLTLDAIDRVVFHQANTRLLQQCIEKLGIDPSRVPMTAPKYGNTGAASIPITLHDSHFRHPLQRGEHILLAGIGGGMTAGAAVLTWH